MSIAIVSHADDLDGVASAVLIDYHLKNIYDVNPVVFFTNYNDMQKTIVDVSDKFNEVWISDLSFSDVEFLQNLIKYHPHTKFMIFDHHSSTRECYEKFKDEIYYFGFVDDGSKCATDLVFEYIQKRQCILTEYPQRLTELAHSRDLWIKNLPIGDELNDAVLIMGPYHAFNEIKNNLHNVVYGKYTPTIELAVNIAKQQLKDSIEIAKNTLCSTYTLINNVNLKLYAVVCNYNASDVADYFIKSYNGSNIIVALLNYKDNRVSFRTNKTTVDNTGITAKYFAQLFNGGGHNYAAGGFLDVSDVINGTVDFNKKLLHSITRYETNKKG